MTLADVAARHQIQAEASRHQRLPPQRRPQQSQHSKCDVSRSSRELACSCIIFLLICLWMHCQCQKAPLSDRNTFPCNLFYVEPEAAGSSSAVVTAHDPQDFIKRYPAQIMVQCPGQSCPNLQIPPSMAVSLIFLSVLAFVI